MNIKDGGRTTCAVCEKRNALDLRPMTVYEPQTRKTFELLRVCPRCQKILEENPNRVLFVKGKSCQSCKMPYGLRVMDRVVKGPRTITYEERKCQVCNVCKKLIKKEIKSGAVEKVAKIGKLMVKKDKAIDIYLEENKKIRKANLGIRRKNRERKKKGLKPGQKLLTLKKKKHSTKKIDKIKAEKNNLVNKMYGYAICHLRQNT